MNWLIAINMAVKKGTCITRTARHGGVLKYKPFVNPRGTISLRPIDEEREPLARDIFADDWEVEEPNQQETA